MELPVNVGEKVYFPCNFSNKVYTLSAIVAEVASTTNKSGTVWHIKTQTGVVFEGSDEDKKFYINSAVAEDNIKKLVEETNEKNAAIGNGLLFTYAGIV